MLIPLVAYLASSGVKIIASSTGPAGAALAVCLAVTAPALDFIDYLGGNKGVYMRGVYTLPPVNWVPYNYTWYRC